MKAFKLPLGNFSPNFLNFSCLRRPANMLTSSVRFSLSIPPITSKPSTNLYTLTSALCTAAGLT